MHGFCSFSRQETLSNGFSRLHSDECACHGPWASLDAAQGCCRRVFLPIFTALQAPLPYSAISPGTCGFSPRERPPRERACVRLPRTASPEHACPSRTRSVAPLYHQLHPQSHSHMLTGWRHADVAASPGLEHAALSSFGPLLQHAQGCWPRIARRATRADATRSACRD
jgi:hypothetical protein